MTEEAPAPAPEPTANTTPAAPAEPTTPAQPVETANEEKPYFSNEQLAEMQNFIENNGGYKVAWKRMKAGISNPPAPQPTPQPAPQPTSQPTPQPTPQPQSEPPQRMEGHITRDEYFAAQYFNGLAAEEKYAPVAEDIKNGKALEAMNQFGISPFDEGGINDAKVRQFLDLYSAAGAAKQPSQPITNTPTVEYVDVKEIKSMADVDQIMRQNIALKAQGKPLHPSTEAAKAWAKEFYKNKK